jgi:integrase
MPPYSGPRATGPYEKRREGRATLWIATVHGADGRRVDASYPTEAAAKKAIDDFNDANRREEVSTIEAAVAAYLAHKRVVDECKDSTLKTTEFRLDSLLGPVYDLAVDRLTKAQAAKLYEKRYTAVATDTHRAELAETRRFFAWAVKKRYVRGNPFIEVAPVGKKSKGKVQLHADEARTFLAHAFEVADAVPIHENTYLGDRARGALGALCALLLALRAGEVAALHVRDVDDEGKMLWVAEEDGKTDAARRPLRVPDMLAERLWGLAKERGGSEPLWIAQHTRQWTLKTVKRMCADAGVPVVTAHGLRGTLATLATAAGVGLLDLSKMLGHSDGGKVATQHYIKKGTAAEAARERGWNGLLQGGKK